MVVLTAMLLASPAGVGSVIDCDGSSTCEGTPQPDEVTGTDRAEKILAEEGGDDEIDGGPGSVRVSGGDGDDQRGNGQGITDRGLLGGGGGIASLSVRAPMT